MKASNYLLLAAFVTGLLLLGGCKKQNPTHLQADSDWVYINESAHDLKIYPAGHKFTASDNESFELKAGQTHTIALHEMLYAESSDKEFGAEDFQTPYARHNGAAIEVGGQKYTLQLFQFFVGRENYAAEKLGNNRFRFTYTFNDQIINQITQ